MQPVPLHMKLRCTGMEILIFINLCPNTQRTPANKFYNKTIIQELKAFSFSWGLCLPSLKLRQTGRPPPFAVYPKDDRFARAFVLPATRGTHSDA
jgi:hypothetical protein